MLRHDTVAGTGNQTDAEQESYADPDVGQARLTDAPVIVAYEYSRDRGQEEIEEAIYEPRI